MSDDTEVYEPRLKTFVDSEMLSLINDWANALKNQRRYTDNTLKAYIKDVAKFCKYFATDTTFMSLDVLRALKTSDFRAWLSYMIDNGRSHRSNARTVSAVKSLIKFIELAKDMDIRPIKMLKLPKLAQLLPHPIDLDIIMQLLDSDLFKANEAYWVTLRDKALYALLYGAGLRIQEALNLKLKDIGDFLNVIGKGNKQRTSPLLEMVHNVISEYVKVCPFLDKGNYDCWIFWGEQGRRLRATTVEHKLQRLRMLNNWPDYCTPHALRHSFASHLIQAGVDMRYVQELLGHNSLSSTQIYTQINNNQILETYKKANLL